VAASQSLILRALETLDAAETGRLHSNAIAVTVVGAVLVMVIPAAPGGLNRGCADYAAWRFGPLLWGGHSDDYLLDLTTGSGAPSESRREA